MPVFKDDERAREILSGKHRSGAALRRTLYLSVASIAMMAVAGFAVMYARKPGPAPVSKVVPADQPINELKPPIPNAPAPKPVQKLVPRPEVKPEVIVLPPVVLGEKTPPQPPVAGPQAAPPETKRPALPGQTRPALPFMTDVRARLRAGDAGAVLELLRNAPPARLETYEQMEAAVLEARALLKLGKLTEARAKLEPYAFADTKTEAGTDALMGNFWALAETKTRCRESELEEVRCGAESWGAAVASLESGRRAEETAKGDSAKLEEARAHYQKALDMNRLDDEDEKDCLDRLTSLTNRMILDPKAACLNPKAIFHKVEPGEVVERIAKKYKVNIGQIKRLNKLNDKLTVRYGQVLKILPGDVLYKVDRTRLHGTLYIGGVFIRRYRVGVGPGNATPLGAYTVEIKVAEPDWYYDGKRVPFGDPANILGTRWMGFSAKDNAGMGAGLGVHGTAFPDSVPGRESKGCVRMINADVEELYDFTPQGGRVEIHD